MNTIITLPIAPILSLPDELLEQVISKSNLESAFAITQTSVRLRGIGSGVACWDRLLLKEPSRRMLQYAARHAIIPSRAWISALMRLNRDVILELELPKLWNTDWKEIAIARLPRSLVEQVQGAKVDVRWKETLVKSLMRLQHKSETGCSADTAMCNYVIVHRKSGISRNRIASREVNPVEIFRVLREQNATTKLFAAMITVPIFLCPTDIEIKIYYTRSDQGAFLTNINGTSLLNAISPIPDMGVAVGPVLITSTIRDLSTSPSPLIGAGNPPRYIGFDNSDLFRLLERLGLNESWNELEVRKRNGWV